MNKNLLVGALIFGGTAVAGYLVKLRIDRIRREMAEMEEVEVETE